MNNIDKNTDTSLNAIVLSHVIGQTILKEHIINYYYYNYYKYHMFYNLQLFKDNIYDPVNNYIYI